MEKLLISMLFIVFVTFGCKPFIMLRYGIKNPKLETPESILAFSKEHNVDSGDIYIFKDTTSYFQCLRDSFYKNNLLSTLFFSSNGYLIDNSKTNSCQWSGGAFLNNFKKDSIYPVDSTHSLKNLTDLIIQIRPNQRLDEKKDFDLTVISIWAKFIGNYNERLFAVSGVAKNRPDLKLKIIFLNVDMLKEWNLKNNQMLR